MFKLSTRKPTSETSHQDSTRRRNRLTRNVFENWDKVNQVVSRVNGMDDSLSSPVGQVHVGILLGLDIITICQFQDDRTSLTFESINAVLKEAY